MNLEAFLISFLNRFRKYRSDAPKPDDVVLGVSATRDASNPFVVFPVALRTQHLGILGLSGSGKTYFIEHMIRQDIRRGTGFVVFDVHGDLADSIVAYLAERGASHPETYAQTVILEPFDPNSSFGFNPLQRTPATSPFFQAQELAYMLHQRLQEQFSPRTEELLRNAFYTLSANGETLLRLPDLLSDKRVRETLIRNVESLEVRQFWKERFDRMSAKMQAVYREPVLSRLSAFLADPQIRDIVGQPTSTFSFREAILNGHWIVINLSKGRLGENSALLGSMLFTKLELEIMGLANVPEKDRRLFTVYADELQNLAGDSFGRLVGEARKYGIALVAGHQFWKQLEPALRQAMLAVGSKTFFRLHYHDALELAGEVDAAEKNRYIRLLTVLGRGEGVARLGARAPVLFTVPAHRPPHPTQEELELLRAHSARRHTRTRMEIRAAIESSNSRPIESLVETVEEGSE